MGQANSPADPSTLVPLSVTDPAFSYLQQLSIFQQPERNQELMTRMAQILGTQQPQPDPVSRIPMANMILPLMGGGMQMGSTAEAPLLSPEQSKMGVAQSAQFQPVADIAGVMAGSALTGPGRAVLGSERGAIGEEAVKLPAFQKWFGGSKVVNESGQPKVVYHGTLSNFEAFDPTRNATSSRGNSGALGMYFTENPQEASTYARGYRDEGGQVMPTFLSIKNPKVIERYSEEADRLLNSRSSARQLREDLIEQGYDGAITPTGEYVAFYPEQVKSALGNVGTFNPKEAHIGK